MKKIIVLVFLLLITGCSANYDLKINFDGTINESGSIYINTNLLGKDGYSSDVKEFLEEVAIKYNFSNYRTKKTFIDSNYIGYNFSHKYNNIKDYSIDSLAIRNLFGGLSVTETEHYVVFKTNGEVKASEYHNLKKDTPTVVESINISISLPYRVVKHNATKVDARSNTYTWVFTGTSYTNIDLEYRDNEIYTFDILNLLRYIRWYIYVIVLFIIIGLIVIFNAKSKLKRCNRI